MTSPSLNAGSFGSSVAANPSTTDLVNLANVKLSEKLLREAAFRQAQESGKFPVGHTVSPLSKSPPHTVHTPQYYNDKLFHPTPCSKATSVHVSPVVSQQSGLMVTDVLSSTTRSNNSDDSWLAHKRYSNISNVSDESSDLPMRSVPTSSRGRRKSSQPQRSPCKSSEAGVVFKFILDSDNKTHIQMTSASDGLLTYFKGRRRAARLIRGTSDSSTAIHCDHSPARRRRRYTTAGTGSEYAAVAEARVSGSHSTNQNNSGADDDESFPASELFYSAFADESFGNRPLQLLRRTSSASTTQVSRYQNSSSNDDNGATGGDDDYDDEDDENLMPNENKKRKKKNAPKKRAAKSARSQAEKICCSCKTTQTPIWREVKEQWGDGWEDVLLCNACGLQWRMAGLRCSDCNYVPRASEKRVKDCAHCGTGQWYRRN